MVTTCYIICLQIVFLEFLNDSHRKYRIRAYNVLGLARTQAASIIFTL